jgi:hypothetical protein
VAKGKRDAHIDRRFDPSAPNHVNGLEFGDSRPFSVLYPIIVSSSWMGRKGFVLRFVSHGSAEILSLMMGVVHVINRGVAVDCVVYGF